jgi:RNA polymerase sigma-70 factor (ECF subfamily)
VRFSDEDFRRLFLRYSPLVHALFRRHGLPPEDSRDLTQETFFRVYKSMGRLRSETKIRAWLFQIANNLWQNDLRYRRAAKRGAGTVPLCNPLEADDPASFEVVRAAVAPDRDPLSDLLDRERSGRLRHAVAALPPQMRRCVVLRIDHELKYREIAAVLQLSIETVKSQVHQARERLCATFGGRPGAPEVEEGEEWR